MKKFFLGFVVLFSMISSYAQPKKVVADKIIATVGDKIILRSEIENSLADMQRQGTELPPNSRCLFLEQALGIKALVLQAEKDSLPVSAEEIEGEIDNRIRYFISQYGSKEVVEQISGRTIYQLKEDFKQSFREQKLAQSMRNKIIEDVKITPAEVKAYFASLPTDSLAFYESEVEIGQIIIYPKASRELDNYAIEQLKEYKQQVESGAKKFETLASLYTDDPGSKQTGGRYEINRNEKQWDPIFLSKAFSLKPGQISNVFKSKFGYHIIQLVSRAGDDAVIRHILKIPQITSFETREGITKLDSVRSKIIAGTMKFGEAVSKYSDDDASKFTGGRIQGRDGSSFLTIDQLERDIVPVLGTLSIGGISQPTEFTDERGRKGVRMIQLISKTEPHRENIRDDYNRIASRALEEKKNNTLEKWFYKNVSGYYINIDPEYSSCPEMKKWTKLTTAAQ
ncbi:peptidylprolyl isomerase [soil metagenome]